MSAKITGCAFFSLIVCCIAVDSSTSSKLHTQQGSSISTTSPSTVPSWSVEALKDIAYYMRTYKFNDYDRRYEADPKIARREFFKGFPRPPLRSLHWEVHKFCEQSLIECLDYLRKRIRQAGMKRTDDTAVVIHEQQWDLNNNSKQIAIVDKDCRMMRKQDDILANPFEGPLERFQWRVTASYYLCWYTMKSQPLLKHLSEDCDNFADCLDPNLGPNNLDYRAKDDEAFSCALYSFCPDPCCPEKHLTKPENCWDMPDNPCFQANPAGQRECAVKRAENTDFNDIVLNRWNVSCFCPRQGFEWSSFYGVCVDVDECALGRHNCDPENEVCLNLPGNFQCVCKWGHTYDGKSKKCKPSDALLHLILHKEENEQEKTNKTLWMKFLDLFQQKSASSKSSEQKEVIIFCIVLLCWFYYNLQ